MPIYRATDISLEKVRMTTFAQEKLLERRDLQRLLKHDISVLSPDLMVIAEEYGDWEDSSRRIDLLCLDDEGGLVVIELKRTADGGHMDLQALRYAAMVSSMTFQQLVDAHTRYLGASTTREKADANIRAFLGLSGDTDAEMKQDVQIILASADFSKELTTSVLWLNKHSLQIRCIRMQPYRLGDQLLLDVQQIVPLPEAEEYETKIRVQEQESRRTESGRHAIFRRFWAMLIERSRAKTQLVTNRTTSSDHWLSGGIGYSGFTLTFSLLKENCRVECFIDLGKDADDRNLAAFNSLKNQQNKIEAAFGGPLDWQALDESRGCRICKMMPGGWRSPEVDWPDIADRLIDEMVKLEHALRAPIHALKVTS